MRHQYKVKCGAGRGAGIADSVVGVKICENELRLAERIVG
jgi:hypothetical protein